VTALRAVLGPGFECSLDAGPFAPRSSLYTVKAKKGKHTFQVEAIDQRGNVGVPVTADWKIKGSGRRRKAIGLRPA
jgi:hypothetical protein